jgi:hypothetical protein
MSSTDRELYAEVHALNSTSQNLLTIAINRNASAGMIMNIVNAGGVAGDVGRADSIHHIPAIQAAIISSNHRLKNGQQYFSNQLILEMIAAPSTLTLSEFKPGHKK